MFSAILGARAAQIFGPLTAAVGQTAANAITGDLSKAITDGVQSVVKDNPQVQQLMGAATQVQQLRGTFTSGFVQGLGGKVEGTVRGYVDQQVSSRLGDLQAATAGVAGAAAAAAAASDSTIASLQSDALQVGQGTSPNNNANNMNLQGGGLDLSSIITVAKQSLAAAPQIQELAGSVGQVRELASVVQPGFVEGKLAIAKNAVQGFANQQITSKLGVVQAASDAAAARLSMTTDDALAALQANALAAGDTPTNQSGNPVNNDFQMEGGGELVLGPSKVPPSVANKSEPSPLPPHMQGGGSTKKRRARHSSKSSRKRQRSSRRH